jgi:hypothetical protein
MASTLQIRVPTALLMLTVEAKNYETGMVSMVLRQYQIL